MFCERNDFMSQLKETKVYSILDIDDWYKRGELIISPKYQRNPVWNQKAQSYLIDTIIRDLPIPQIFLRQNIDTNTRKTKREVIDGQQRLRAIIGYLNNEFSILKLHNKEYGGVLFSDLEDEIKERILDYQIPVELIKSKDDSVIYDMFSRVNTNGSMLNRQELRNAKYWGDFKILVYKLTSKWRSFFVNQDTFTNKEFIRMDDNAFVSSLLILLREGIVSETPSRMDNYYKDNEILLDGEENENIFDDIIGKIESVLTLDSLYESTYFNKKNYIYTLFCYFLYTEDKLKKSDFLKEKFPVSEITYSSEILLYKLKEIESIITSDDKPAAIEFVSLHKTRTTNEIERMRRVYLFFDFLIQIDGDKND